MSSTGASGNNGAVVASSWRSDDGVVSDAGHTNEDGADKCVAKPRKNATVAKVTFDVFMFAKENVVLFPGCLRRNKIVEERRY